MRVHLLKVKVKTGEHYIALISARVLLIFVLTFDPCVASKYCPSDYDQNNAHNYS